MKTNRTLNLLKTILYILAALVGIIGLIAGLSLIGSAGRVDGILIPFQMIGGDIVGNLIAPHLRSLLSSLGVATLIFSLVFSLLLFAVGRLLGHHGELEARLARLEAQAG
jgi:hypothetical protein